MEIDWKATEELRRSVNRGLDFFVTEYRRNPSSENLEVLKREYDKLLVVVVKAE